MIFKTVSWKNFLSTGNVENTIRLDDQHSTLIVGKNGNGKSTMIEAITFALFGKPFRNINKNQLINSINKKNCQVTVEFESNSKQYRVVRGIKPNIFEIYCDGNLINQDAALKDYQKVLEQQILRLNYKTFTQVVILGSSSFVPFMQLPAAQRREVIEDILDIKIFSSMNAILKEKMVVTRDAIKILDAKIETEKTRIDNQKTVINLMVSAKKDAVDSIQLKIDENNAKIAESNANITRIMQEIEELRQKTTNKKEVDENIAKANLIKYRLQEKITNSNTELLFFNSNTVCSTCQQDIDDTFKQGLIEKLNAVVEDNTSKLTELATAMSKLDAQTKAITEVNNQITDKNIELSNHNNTVTILNSQNETFRKEIEAANSDIGDIEEEKRKLKALASNAVEIVVQKNKAMEERQLQEVSATLLKDTGIKTAIIKEYLPLMNKLINKYLAAMDLFVKFELDEGFNEIIRSRHRDEFTYASFSEGEKQKIDISLLFAWRKIAEMKNSVNTNLLIMDEVMDASLDGASTDMLLDVINEMNKQTNIFIISHKTTDTMKEKFDQVIEFQKRNDFSIIV